MMRWIYIASRATHSDNSPPEGESTRSWARRWGGVSSFRIISDPPPRNSSGFFGSPRCSRSPSGGELSSARRVLRTTASLIIVVLLATHGTVHAVQPDEMLRDPAMEQRARALGQDLRCLVCQNQSIDDSDAELARDLRILLRQRLVAGDTDAQAKQYLVDRYGEYVLLKPPVKTSTLLLWYGPLLLLLGALVAVIAFYRRRVVDAPPPLSPEEQQKLNQWEDA